VTGVQTCALPISSVTTGTDTDLYLYYDSAKADNSTYVGLTNSAPADSVWTNGYSGVYHLAESGATCYDSSPNDKDGTKYNATNPAQVAGMIGYGQNYNHANDWIDLGAALIPATADFSVTALSYSVGFDSYWNAVIAQSNNSPDVYWAIGFQYGAPNNHVAVMPAGNKNGLASSINTWYQSQFKKTSNVGVLYRDTQTSVGNNTVGTISTVYNTFIGDSSDKTQLRMFNGYLDEVRISSVARTKEWFDADYYSQHDGLNTFASQEIYVVTKEIINKTVYGIYCATADSSFRGNINSQDVKVTGVNLLSYRNYALTYDKQNIKLYLDGVQVATQPYTTAITANDSTLTIGKSFSGEIDDVMIFNRALTADEIWSYYTRRVEGSEPYIWQGGDAVINDITIDGTIAVADALTVGTGVILAGTSSVSVLITGCLATDYIFVTNTKPAGAVDILPLFVDSANDSIIVYTDNGDTLATDIPFNWLRIRGQ
jgi:hypothetical protein